MWRLFWNVCECVLLQWRAGHRCRLGLCWPLRPARWRWWRGSIPVLRLTAQPVNVGLWSISKAGSWRATAWSTSSQSECPPPVRKKKLTWPSKFCITCKYMCFFGISDERLLYAWHFAFIKLCMLAIVCPDCPVSPSWASWPTELSELGSLKTVENHRLWDTHLLLQVSWESRLVSLERLRHHKSNRIH